MLINVNTFAHVLILHNQQYQHLLHFEKKHDMFFDTFNFCFDETKYNKMFFFFSFSFPYSNTLKK